MSNVLAIARKELKGYFSSPIAYAVIGLFALTFGFFFYTLLLYFDQNAARSAGLGGGPSVNVNEQLLRPVFMNAMVILLFMLPLVTMRTYSEEKRSGTIELLLTAPLMPTCRSSSASSSVPWGSMRRRWPSRSCTSASCSGSAIPRGGRS